MLYNSIEFFLFLPIVFALYWSLPKRFIQGQNWILLISSYIFYAYWDWRFLGLLFFSSFLDFKIGDLIFKAESKRIKKILLGISVGLNIGVLGTFKYLDFFIEAFNDSFKFFGTTLNISTLELILPIGISFYTFQTLSYTIDVYRGYIRPEKKIVNFLVFVSFFPQIIAGPIERAKDFLPQIEKRRYFDYNQGIKGCRLIIFGLFYKMVLSDGLLRSTVNEMFDSIQNNEVIPHFIGTITFYFQIFFDFS